MLNDSGYFGPVVLFVEKELCVGERRHLEVIKAAIIDGVVADAKSALSVFGDVVDNPRMSNESLTRVIKISVALCSSLERGTMLFASRLAKRLVWYTAFQGDYRLNMRARSLAARITIENLAAFERTVAQCRLRTLV